MKTRILAAAAAASLLLTGCAGLLDRDYVSVTVHSTTPATEGDNSALRAESYQELVNILTYLVSQNMPSASIRLYESEDVQADLERACVEVAQEYPLGAYAVDYIQYHVSPILSYHEAEVQITYRRTKEQMDAIVSATGITAIRSQLESALEQFSPECTLSISYFDGGVEDIQALFRQAYFAVPDAAEDLPDVSVSLYPDSGRQRIVELELNYHLSQEELLRRQETTRYQCQELARDLKSYTGDLAHLRRGTDRPAGVQLHLRRGQHALSGPHRWPGQQPGAGPVHGRPVPAAGRGLHGGGRQPEWPSPLLERGIHSERLAASGPGHGGKLDLPLSDRRPDDRGGLCLGRPVCPPVPRPLPRVVTAFSPKNRAGGGAAKQRLRRPKIFSDLCLTFFDSLL